VETYKECAERYRKWQEANGRYTRFLLHASQTKEKDAEKYNEELNLYVVAGRTFLHH